MGLVFRVGTPEDAGICSRRVSRFIDELEKCGVNMHGFSLSQGNIILAEGFWKPFHRDFQHRMYSVGKSLISLGIGLLEADGRISLDDHICDYFPEKLPETVHPYIRRMTIEHLLTMRSAHHSSTYKRSSGDWVESFFQLEPANIPGSFFSYDTSASHVLTALIEKLTGKSLLEFLKSGFLDEIGISPDARFLPDPAGVSQGGSGLICTQDDIRNIGYLVLNGGRLQGKNLLPEDYLNRAVSKHSSTDFNPEPDLALGYGYQFWITREKGFAMYGMGGQLVIGVPRFNLLLVTTADTQGDPCGVSNIYRSFWDILVPAFYNSREDDEQDSEIPGSEPPGTAGYSLLQERLANLSVPVRNTAPSRVPALQAVQGEFLCKELRDSFGIDEIRLTVDKDSLSLSFSHNGTLRKMRFGINRYIEGSFFLKDFSDELPCYGVAAVLDDGVVELTMNVSGVLFGTLKLLVSHHREEISVSIITRGEYFLEQYRGVYNGSRQ